MRHRSLVLRVLAWFGQKARELPWRQTCDPYGIWVSEIMLQQTQVKTVIPYWERWMGELPTVEALARAGPEKIHKLWEGLGYYHRVRHLHKAARAMVERHGGKVPEGFEELLRLPGIGRYTAGAICSIAFAQAKPVLDGNVIRVLTRVFGIVEDTRKAQTKAVLWQVAEDLVREAVAIASKPARRAHTSQKERRGNRISCLPSVLERPASSFNQALMELGALVCTARSPRCGVCPLAKACEALRDGRVEEIPITGRRVKPTARRFVAFVVQKRNQLLVRQRPSGVVNAHLWEFPNIEVGRGNPRLLRAAELALGLRPAGLVPLGSLKHSITRYRIRLQVFRAAMKRGQPASRCHGSWIARSKLERLPFTAAHKRIVAQLKRG